MEVKRTLRIADFLRFDDNNYIDYTLGALVGHTDNWHMMLGGSALQLSGNYVFYPTVGDRVQAFNLQVPKHMLTENQCDSSRLALKVVRHTLELVFEEPAK